MFWDRIMSKRPPEIPDRVSVTHVVPAGSNLDLILRGTNGAVNKLADAIGGGLRAIALALSTPHDNSTEVKGYVEQLKASQVALQTAIDNQTKEK